MAYPQCPPGSEQARNQALKLVEEARAMLASGGCERVANHLKLALAYDPHCTAARELLQTVPDSGQRVPEKAPKKMSPIQRANEAERVGDILGSISILQAGLDTKYRGLCAHRLGWIAIKHQHDLERGIGYFRMAVESAPSNPSFKQSLQKAEKRRAAVRRSQGWLGRLFGPRTVSN